MTEVEKLAARFKKMGVTDFKVARGEKPATPEQLAAEINRSLDRIEAGDFEVLDFNDIHRK